jgi:hypothetical protein
VAAGQYDFQTIVTHEIGHAIGLDHSGDLGSVMYFELSSGESRRDLTEQDLRFVANNGGGEALMAQGFALADDHRRGIDVLDVTAVGRQSNAWGAIFVDPLRRTPINDWSQRIDHRHASERKVPAAEDARIEPMRDELVDQVFSFTGRADAGEVLGDIEGNLGETDLRQQDPKISLQGVWDSRD